MSKSRALIVFTSLALIAGSPALLADPGNGNGNGNGNGKDKGSAHGNKGGQGGSGNQGQGGGKKGGGGGNYSAPQIDIGGVRVILGDNRDYWRGGSSLPPGIQKNLARGKPLPPGIAKKLDGRLLGRLPHYDGYEWQQAGTDLILVTIATGIIYEVLNDVLN
ncbi:hypothetical protein GCM10009091_27730 [Pseudomonas brenneri]|uniref:Nickel/cobalt transporter regulator n=1 Tax=Pseudomonas brenneri TaxID=129817 RepID=A0A5B2UMD9_9PSED|nr:anti-virulence regulator CigR family protein [Pseudomonas brenneri]KAA2227662.1 RcnB family protein [Pseudomonas brenneri]TWR80092.1 RcnB family protein [Pseudomonas brenneri]GGL44356.1 hypothetical protein GCM10009091_27730 [Pseudomonas brenneri]SDV00635.1 Nickel/cobalt transporter regulator [Pseudomonas brenneri]